MRAMGVAQDVEGDRGRDSRPLTRRIQWPLLVGGAPHLAVAAQENVLGWPLALGPARKAGLGFIGQHDVADFPLASRIPKVPLSRLKFADFRRVSSAYRQPVSSAACTIFLMSSGQAVTRRRASAALR